MDTSALNHLQNMPKEPKLWDSLKRKIDNKNYQNEAVDFNDERKKLAKSLGYKPFVLPDKEIESKKDSETSSKWQKKTEIKDKVFNSSNEEKIKNNIDKNTINFDRYTESVIFPIISRFEWKYEEWEELIIQKNLAREWEEDLFKILKDISSELKNSEFKSYISEFITNNEKKQEKEEENIWEQKVKIPEDFKQNEFLEKNKNTQTVELLAKNYIKIPEKKSWDKEIKWNFEENLKLTFEITANKIIDWKQINRSESFDEAMRDIREGRDIKEMFFALSYVNSYVNTKEWLKWKKSKKEFERITKEHKDKYFTEKIKNKIKEIPDENIKKLIKHKKPEEVLKMANLDNKTKEILTEIKKWNDERIAGDVFETNQNNPENISETISDKPEEEK